MGRIRVTTSISLDPEVLRKLDEYRAGLPRSRYIELILRDYISRRVRFKLVES